MFEDTEKSIKFWVAVSLALLAKFLLTETPITKKQKMASIVSGILVSFFGAQTAADYLGVAGIDGFVLVAATLAITGEHFVRAVLGMGPTFAEYTIKALLAGKDFARFVLKENGDKNDEQ